MEAAASFDALAFAPVHTHLWQCLRSREQFAASQICRCFWQLHQPIIVKNIAQHRLLRAEASECDVIDSMEIIGRIAANTGHIVALEALQARAGSRNGSVRAAALGACGLVTISPASSSVLATIRGGLIDAEAGVRAAALRGLARASRGDADAEMLAFEALRKGLRDGSAVVRAASVEALVELNAEGCRCMRSSAESGGEGGGEGKSAALAGLCIGLEDRDGSVRAAALKALPRLAAKGDERAIAAVLPLVCHEEWYVRAAALRALVQVAPTGHLDALQAIRACTSDRNGYVNIVAAETLAKVIDVDSQAHRTEKGH
eukprot:TRINITY_DN63184_c0_g1_i1.p1 TRINITY_DN63184_c0_g1~~TRINITY_DN63184_c0_g1_i1.p1  ORF type:complete len:317 (+),score=86.34 TRINITY_DN63184_c0_g1_i1:138-1088(+)